MPLINFYNNIWKRRVSLKDRILFGLMFLLLFTLYFYTAILRNKHPWDLYLVEIISVVCLILFILAVKPFGSFVIRLWLCISGTIGRIVFFIVQLMLFYLILSPVYVLINLTKKKNNQKTSNWEMNPHKNTNYRSPG